MSFVLTRHLAGRFALTFMAVLSILCTLVTTLKLIESSRAVLQHGAPVALVCLLAACIALDYFHRMFFIAIVLAAALLSNRMARNGELVGLWAQGISPAGVAGPWLMVTLAFTALAFWSHNHLLPQCMARRTLLLRQHLGRVEPATLYFEKRSPWFFDGTNIYHFPDIDPQKVSISRPRVWVMHQDRLQQLVQAQHLTWQDGLGWLMHDAVTLSVAESLVQHTPMRAWPMPLKPKDLLAHVGNPRELPIAAARTLVARRDALGLETIVHRMEVMERIAHPFTAPLSLLAVLPMMLRQSRKKPLSHVLRTTVIFVAIVVVLGQVFRLLALSHQLPVFVGAWGQSFVAIFSTLGSSQIIFSGRTNVSKVSAST